MAEVCCHLPKGGRGSAATYSCAPEIRQTALPGLEGKAGLKGQQELAHPGDHASLTASCDHIQVLGSACPPNPGGAGVLSQAGCQSPFLTGLPIGDLLLSSPPPLSEVSHSPLFCSVRGVYAVYCSKKALWRDLFAIGDQSTLEMRILLYLFSFL